MSIPFRKLSSLKSIGCSEWSVTFQRTDPAREERREHPVPAGGQQGRPQREASRAARRLPRPRAELAGALRGDQRQDQGEC